jgi:hypothetical protein
MAAPYDHFKENPGFTLWNVVGVDKKENTWNIDLVGRDREHIARVRIKKANLQEELTNGILSLTDADNYPYTAREDHGITIVNRNTCYMIEVCFENGSQENVNRHYKIYEGLQDNDIGIMAMSNARGSRATYLKWKALPQTPLENPINSFEKRECYFGLPYIVYMHLVGQLCTVI